VSRKPPPSLSQKTEERHVEMPLLMTPSILSVPALGRADCVTSSSYSSVMTRAQLELHGNLSEMTQNWTHPEILAGRRLVVFTREVLESIIHCYFHPKHLFDPPTNIRRYITVSCIYFAQKDLYYVTGYELILLLEYLIGVCFTDQEKNRIRRNLDEYEHLTVSKSKEETCKFFQLVMRFPDPKPRRIEKDLKVFAWSSIEAALTKIIGKFRAGYGSIKSIIVESNQADPHVGIIEPMAEYPSGPFFDNNEIIFTFDEQQSQWTIDPDVLTKRTHHEPRTNSSSMSSIDEF